MRRAMIAMRVGTLVLAPRTSGLFLIAVLNRAAPASLSYRPVACSRHWRKATHHSRLSDHPRREAYTVHQPTRGLLPASRPSVIMTVPSLQLPEVRR